MSASHHRLSILSTGEIDDLYGLPRFTSADRDLFFQLSGSELAAVTAIRTVSVAAHLILQLGYFKAKRQFFAYEKKDTAEDLGHLLHQHFPDADVGVIKTPSRPIQAQLHQTILKLFDYRHCDGKAKIELEQRALRTVRLTTLPLHILGVAAKREPPAHSGTWLPFHAGHGGASSSEGTQANSGRVKWFTDWGHGGVRTDGDLLFVALRREDIARLLLRSRRYWRLNLHWDKSM